MSASLQEELMLRIVELREDTRVAHLAVEQARRNQGPPPAPAKADDSDDILLKIYQALVPMPLQAIAATEKAVPHKAQMLSTFTELFGIVCLSPEREALRHRGLYSLIEEAYFFSLAYWWQCEADPELRSAMVRDPDPRALLRYVIGDDAKQIERAAEDFRKPVARVAVQKGLAEIAPQIEAVKARYREQLRQIRAGNFPAYRQAELLIQNSTHATVATIIRNIR